MREPEETTIDGRRYRVAPLPAGKGLAVLTMITKVVGPALAAAPSLAHLAGAAGEAFRDVFAQLDEAQVARLCATMADATLVEPVAGSGKLVPLASVFDVHFAAEFGAMLAWMTFCLKVNYSGFLAAIQSKAASSGAPPAASA